MPSYKYLAFGHYFSWFSSSPFLSFFLFPFCFFAFPGERGCTQSALHCGESRDANKYYSQRPCRYRAVCREAYTIHIANFAVRNGVWPPYVCGCSARILQWLWLVWSAGPLLDLRLSTEWKVQQTLSYDNHPGCMVVGLSLLSSLSLYNKSFHRRLRDSGPRFRRT
jgi:hypothetical protein